MRARLVLVAVLSLLLFEAAQAFETARADDFDDDFASERKPSTKVTAEVAPKREVGAEAKPAAEVASTTAEVRVSPEASSKAKRAPDVYNTILGLTGGVHVVDANSGEAGTFRIAAAGQFFRRSGFLLPVDQHRRVGGSVSLSATPLAYLELAAALTTYSNESSDGTRSVYQVIGDSHLFAKSMFAVTPVLSVGGDMELALLNGVGGIGLSGRGTSVGLRANASADLQKLKQPLPLLLRSGLRYYFDNSARLIEETEDSRYATLSDANLRENEVRHLISRVERFAFQVNRVDSLTLSLGVEAPLAISERVSVHPIAEWALGIPVNRQGYDCVTPQSAADQDGCLIDEGIGSWPSTITLGLRILPWVRGLSVLIATDVATSGQKNPVRELAPNAPYDLIFSLGYAYDTRPTPPVVIEKTRTVVQEPARQGRILGDVVDRDTSLGIPRAVVHFAQPEVSDIVADQSGHFIGYRLPVGAHPLHVSAPDYEEADCQAALTVAGEDQTTRCELVAIPKRGKLRGTVHSEAGAPIVGAVVRISGGSVEAVSITTDALGQFEKADLGVGSYQAQVEAEEYLARKIGFDILLNQVSTPLVTLTPKPERPQAELSAEAIKIKRQVQFVTNSAEIRAQSNALMAEIADVLLRNPQVKRVEVQGHTDDVGTVAINQELSQRRAEAVRDWLITAGVDAERMTAVGYGRGRPLAPNITEANRARNRRVAFEILEQPSGEPAVESAK